MVGSDVAVDRRDASAGGLGGAAAESSSQPRDGLSGLKGEQGSRASQEPQQALSTEELAVVGSAWEPMRLPIYRAFWLVALMSNFGTWVHEVGAAWLMMTLDPSPVMVSAVRACLALPVFLFSLPVGVLADRMDRRRLMIVTQIGLLVVATTMGLLAAAEAISPLGLLGLTFAMGVGMCCHVPTWQALLPEIVPRRMIPAAVGLGSISFNLARSLGPAIGGLLVATLGAAAAFFFNALSFLGVIAVLLFWRRPTNSWADSARQGSFGFQLVDGLKEVLGRSELRMVFAHLMMFLMPASCLWALLPLLVRTQLGWQASGLGLVIGLFGAGAVAAAAVIPTVRSRFGSHRLVLGGFLLFGLMCGLLAMNPPRWLYLAMFPVLGGVWMGVLTTLNATCQLQLPDAYRARGMSIYLMTFSISMAIGATGAGWLAQFFGLEVSLAVAALGLWAAALVGLGLPLPRLRTG